MEKNMDSLLKELIQDQIDNTPCPPRDEIWNNIKEKLMEEQRAKVKANRPKKLRPLIAACITIALLISLFVLPGTNTMAFTNKILKGLFNIGEDTIQIYKKVIYGNRTETDSKHIEDPRIKEVQREVSFKLLVPSYIPEGYELEHVFKDKKIEKRESVTFLYSSVNNSDDVLGLTIVQQYYPDTASLALSLPRKENPSAESFIKGSTEYVFIDNAKYKMLLWNNDNLSYEIMSNMGKDEMVRIAESMGHGALIESE